MKRYCTAYWLIPARAHRELFEKLIQILAAQFDTPRFTPHLTILVTAGKGGSPKEILRQIRPVPLRLPVRSVGHSSKFTKTLFVRVRADRMVSELLRELTRAGAKGVTRLSDPHISLLYKKLPARTRRELAAVIKLPIRRVRFDSIRAVRCALPTVMTTEVRRWRVLARRSFSR